MAIFIKKFYKETEEATPSLLKEYSKEDLLLEIEGEISIYNDQLQEFKKRPEMLRKTSGRLALLNAYKNNLINAKTIEEVSYVMSTSVNGRYREEDENENILLTVFESDQRIYWELEEKQEMPKQKTAWERLQSKLEPNDDGLIDDGFEIDLTKLD